MSSSPQPSGTATPEPATPPFRPTKPFREECLSILINMDIEHTGSNKIITVVSYPNGHAIGGLELSYDRALYACVIHAGRPLLDFEDIPNAYLHLDMPDLYEALRNLALAGPGHTIDLYRCKFWFWDKVEDGSGDFDEWRSHRCVTCQERRAEDVPLERGEWCEVCHCVRK